MDKDVALVWQRFTNIENSLQFDPGLHSVVKMKVNYLEFINCVLALALFGVAVRKNLSWILAAFFAYGSLYFAHTAYPLVSGAPVEEISAMHAVDLGSGIISKVATVMFLAAMFVILVLQVKKISAFDKWVLFLFSTAALLVVVGFLVNIKGGSGLQLQNVISVVGMMALICFGYMASRSDDFVRQPKYGFIFTLNIVLVLAVSVAFYEVFSGRAWSGTSYGNGVRVNRASSIFFNPNLYAFWSALIYLGYSYLILVCDKCRQQIFLGMFLAAAGLYFSGGRSAAILLFGVLFMCGVCVRGADPKWRWVPLVAISAFFVLIYSISTSLLVSDIGSHRGWESLSFLGERIGSTPLDVLRYVLNKIPIGVIGEWGGQVSPQIVESIEGRFVVAKSDSGFVALYTDTGWLGLAALLGIWVVLFGWSIRAYLMERQVFGIYSLGALLYCLFSGFSMRFQVFPVWLLIGVSLVPCLIFWRKLGKRY